MKRLLAALMAVTLTACGGGLLRDTARVATVTGHILKTTRDQLVEIRRAELDACSDEECLNRIEENWRAPILAYESARTAHALLVDALVIAYIAEEDGVSIATLRAALDALANACDNLVAVLDLAGVELPSEVLEASRIATQILRSV